MDGPSFSLLQSLHEQFALSFDGKASPTVALWGEAEGQPNLLPSTWGFGWYPENQRAAAVLRDAGRGQPTSRAGLLERWDEVHSSLFLGHTHGLHQDAADAESQPYVKSYAARQWLFSNAGDLSPELRTALSLDESFDIAPVGTSAGEHAFSWVVAEIRRAGCRTIEEFGWPRLQEVLVRLNEFGAASFLLSDGIDLVAYRDVHERSPLHWTRLTPPHDSKRLDGRTFTIDFDGPLDDSRTLLAISTYPMRGAQWMPMEPGELRVARRGAFVWSSHPNGIDEQVFSFLRLSPPTSRTASYSPYPHTTGEQQQYATASPPTAPLVRPGPDVETLSVVHETVYRYELPVERSTHRFCLRPVRDDRQEVLDHKLTVSVDGVWRDFEDVFGNRATLLEISKPFQEMRIESRSTLRVAGVLATQLKSPLHNEQIPLVWMPWQRQMMQAYLMPPELPEPELRELSEFAMSFVIRNDYDLVETLLDMNRTIYRDFVYVPGSTTVETTPFQVYVQRRGVCQDFANVLICLARLLSVPARYRVGYIYTGGSYENQIQSDASHAWAEVYLPWIGWFGFDPTNGCLAGSDHVRTACGRQFRDAAPTTGTIYRGGGRETLEVHVRVERLDGFEMGLRGV